MNNPEPDRQDRTDKLAASMRFGCGGVLGLLFGFFLAATIASQAWHFTVLILVSFFVCGLLAVRYGDDFLAKLFQSFPF